MLTKARTKAPALSWIRAETSRLPFPAAVFAGALCTLALHHFDDLGGAFSEIHRVLAADGRLVLFTATPEQTARYWLAEYFPEAIRRSAEQLPSLDTIAEALEAAGFSRPASETYEVRPDLRDLFLYSGKHRPEIYLDAAVRRGISTFASLADRRELATGLARLQDDIASGRIAEVRRRYRHAAGDYLFAVAVRCR